MGKNLILENDEGDINVFGNANVHQVTRDTIFVKEGWSTGTVEEYPRTKFNIMCLMEFWGYSPEVGAQASCVTKTKKGMVGDVLDQSVNIIDWSVRVHNVFRHMGITKIRDIVALTRNDLLKTRNLGVGSVNEIERRLREIGLTLKEGETDVL